MIVLSVPVRNSRLAVIGNALDAATTPGLLCIYAGNRPAAGTAVDDQCLLVEIHLPKPSILHLEQGTLTFAPIGDGLCRRSGQAVWARFTDGDRHWIADMDAGLIGSGAEVELSALMLFAGGAVEVQLAVMTE
jgi:hypothetical protein